MTLRNNSKRLTNGDESFGTVFHIWRNDKRMTQAALATKLACTSSYISLLESDQRHPPRSFIDNLDATFHLDPADKKKFLEAAGYETDVIAKNIQQIVGTLRSHLPIPFMDQSTILFELQAIISGWESVFLANVDLGQGNFEGVQTHLAVLAEQKHYPLALRTKIVITLCYALVRLGKLEEAESFALRIRNEVTASMEYDHNALLLLPEILALQSDIIMRDGGYNLAADLIDESRAYYEKYLADPDWAAIAHFGLGKSYKQLAQIALLQGKPTVAQSYCARAEAYIQSVTGMDSSEKNAWLRHIGELKAWAFTEKHQPEKAMQLRKNLQEIYRAERDLFSEAKNYLYMGDDLRRKFEEALSGQNINLLVSAEVRREQLRRALRKLPHIEREMVQAEECYERACRDLEARKDYILLGRCYRGRGIILRFKSALHSNRDYYLEARNFLLRALEIEQKTKQDRRVPSVYESLAELEWDWEHTNDARKYYERAYQALETARFKSESPSTEILLSRIAAARTRLSEVSPDPEPHLSATAKASSTWNALAEQLRTAVRLYLEKHAHKKLLLPVAYSERDTLWLQQVVAVEKLKQPRYLAQNALSSALSMLLPAGYDATTDVTFLHQRRVGLLKANLQESNAIQHFELCWCDEVMGALESNVHARRVVSGQAQEALTLMETYPDKYSLIVSPYEMPLAFEVQGTWVMLEISRRQGEFLKDIVAFPQPDAVACFAINDGDLAEVFRGIFCSMEKEIGTSPADTRKWLQEALNHAMAIAATG
jgi:transcriptional regulator with XRE-family HTH domain